MRMITFPVTPEISDRFWSHVVGNDVDECWLWQAGLNDGYGRVKVLGRHIPAHRYAYTELRGEIPDGLQLDHLCRERRCVNPWHLEPVSHAENLRRAAPFSVSGHDFVVKQECRRGHRMVGENVLVEGDGRRRCRECRRAKDRRCGERRRRRAS